MKIPESASDLSNFLRFIIDTCMASAEERGSFYDKRRKYFLYGQNVERMVRHNRLNAHLALVSSFIMSPDSLVYSMSAPRNAEEGQIDQITALQDSWNQDVQDDGISDVIAEAVTWSLVYDTMIIKQGWNDITEQGFATLIQPDHFGVFREDLTDFDSQQAFVEKIVIDYDEACERLTRAGKPGDIPLLQGVEADNRDIGLTDVVSRLILSNSFGPGLLNTVAGSVNPDYDPSPSFKARVDAPVCALYEVTVWDSDRKDFRLFHVLDPAIVISDSLKTIEAIRNSSGKMKVNYASDTNFFLPQETPYTPITVFSLPKYFWGDCHEEHLIPLQDWSSDRLDQIDTILKKQTDPPGILAGFMGLEDEKAAALNGPGAWIADSAPTAKAEMFPPQMPEDLFKEYESIGGLFLEASGLTENVAGKGTGGARGGKQNKQMQITGGGRIRRAAVGLEKALVRIGDLGVRLKMKNDDGPIRMADGKSFYAAQASQDFTMRVAGHSHSPLFTMETEEMATLLLKAKAVDQEQFVRLLHPPQQDSIIHALRRRQAAEAKAVQERAAHGLPEPKAPKEKKDRSGED